MDAHDTIRLWEGYKEYFNNLPSEIMYTILIDTGIQTVEEFLPRNFAMFLKLVEFLDLDVREKNYLEVQSELVILITGEDLPDED